MKKYYALVSGSSAAAASLFGKLCGLPTIEDFLVLRVICFALMLLMNTFVWTFYVKALQASESTLSATVLSAAANYLISALCGVFIFNEAISVLWLSGATFITCGLLLIVKSQSASKKNK